MAEEELKSQVINNQFIIGRKLGEGSYGTLRLGKNGDTKEHVAIKFERMDHETPTLLLEFQFYKAVKGAPNFPSIYYFGKHQQYNVLIMELLGPSLENLFTQRNHSFTEKTIINIMIQLIEMMRVMHRRSIIYRDVKPENFLVGNNSETENTVHIVDFGLAKFYKDDDGNHIAYREDKGVIGTARYMSTNAHEGKETSRRDDLEAIGYVGLYFQTGGKLPWQGLHVEGSQKRKYRKIGEVKKSCLENSDSLEELCQGKAYFVRYFKDVKLLRFAEEPDYNRLKGIFQKIKDDQHYDNNMDWTGTIVNRRHHKASATDSNVRLGERTKLISHH